MTKVLTKRNEICKEANYSESDKNSASGITLIALVITIIVLVILAGVTIVSLTGKNGILEKTQETNGTNAYYSAEDQVKIAYMTVKTEIMKEKTSNGAYDATTEENTTKLGQIVEKDLNDTKYWAVNYGTAGTIEITYTNSTIRENSIAEGKPSQDRKVNYMIELTPQDATLESDVFPKQTPTLDLSSTSVTLKKGASTTITVTNSGDGELTVTGIKESIANVSTSGNRITITGVSRGNYNLTVYAGESKRFTQSSEVKLSVKVTDKCSRCSGTGKVSERCSKSGKKYGGSSPKSVKCTCGATVTTVKVVWASLSGGGSYYAYPTHNKPNKVKCTTCSGSGWY